MVKASCTWGDGPDVMVSFSKDKEGRSIPFILYENPIYGSWLHGHVENGSFDLTTKEALKLAAELIEAAGGCKYMEETLKMYEEEKHKGDEKNG